MCIVTNTCEGAVHNAEAFNDTADILEEACSQLLAGIHLQITDFETATVIVALETVHALIQWDEFLVLHVDVGSLLDIDIAVSCQMNIFINSLQILNTCNHDGIFFSSHAQ